MTYKARIDYIRSRQEAHRANIGYVAAEIQAVKAGMFDRLGNIPKVNALMDEYNQYIQLYNAEERLITELQPWYRKLFGVPY